MSLPSTAWLACVCLLWAVATPAQPRAPREKKERQVPLLRGPAEPPPQVRVAAGVLTSLSFNVPLAGARLESRERFTRMDVGASALYLEPALELAPTERLALHVTFADGREAVLFLVSDPNVVDSRVDFTLPERSAEASQRDMATTLALCEARSRQLEELQAWCEDANLTLLALAGMLDDFTIEAVELRERPAMLHILRMKTYRLLGWLVLTVEVRNTGAAPWIPSRAQLTPAVPGARVRVVFPEATLPPGATTRVAIEVQWRTPGAAPRPGATYALRLCDNAEEHCLSFSHVALK
jgi:uncharacterized protein (TIGR02268 family)